MEKKTNFSDVPAGHWAENVIQVVSEAGIMIGYGDGSFKPDQPVTRAEMAVIVAKLLELN
ncbi:MAG: S-layer homology domain-containing protein [Paenibacillaceae bacterium]